MIHLYLYINFTQVPIFIFHNKINAESFIKLMLM